MTKYKIQLHLAFGFWHLTFICFWLIFFLLIPYYSFAEVSHIKIKGDFLEYSGGIYTVKGSVVITQENRTLTASTVTLDNNTGDVTAYGNVEFVDGDNFLSSDSLFINIRTSYTKIGQGRMFIKEDNYHIEGDSIERLSEDRYSIKRATFTTCDGDPPCWRFRGRNINIHLNHIFTARDVSFSVRNVPILYLPYIALPILQERQTGFLIPRIGYNTGEGLKLNNSFFWAISESQDATIYADYYGEKGWGSGLEYRYILSQDTSGQFNGYYINDTQVGKERWNVKYFHRQLISEDLSARLRVNYLNDKTLYKDISEDIGERLQRTQDSDLYMNRRWDPLSLHLWAQYIQNLTGPNEGIYQRLPEVGLKVMESRISTLPVYWNITSSVSRWEEVNTDLTRLHLAPEISARFSGRGIAFIQKIGTGQTFYYIDGSTNPTHSSLFTLVSSASTKFYRPFSSEQSTLLHFVEPSIAYEYTEGEESEVRSQKLDLIEENNGKNTISVSLINRIVSMNGDKRYEPIYLRLTQMYHINSPDPLYSREGFSDLRLEAIIRFQDTFSLETDNIYSYRDDSLISSGTDLKFRDERGYLTIGQRYSKTDAIEFLTASAAMQLQNIDTSIGIWYDNKDRIMRETNYSIRYGSQCWGVTISYRYRPEEEQFNLLFTIKGVGSVGGF